MIIQPEWGTRNVNKYFYENEARRIAAFNEIFGDVELTAAEMRTLVWLCGWEECTVENVLSVGTPYCGDLEYVQARIPE